MLYFVTLTTSGGFSELQTHQVRTFLKDKSDPCMLVAESHKSGSLHLHAAADFEIKDTGNVTRLFHRFYEKHLDLEVSANSIIVKKVTDQIGIFHYLIKDLKGPPLLLRGWKMTWIQEQCRANVAKIPRKILRKNTLVLGMSTAAKRVQMFAESTAMPLTGKMSFVQVVATMESEGYLFHLCKPRQLYTQVMSLTGDSRPCVSYWDMVLFGLD